MQRAKLGDDNHSEPVLNTEQKLRITMGVPLGLGHFDEELYVDVHTQVKDLLLGVSNGFVFPGATIRRRHFPCWTTYALPGGQEVLNTHSLGRVFPLAVLNRLLLYVCDFRIVAAYGVSLSRML